MGIPIPFLGLFDDKDEFYDTRIGRNVRVARHALAFDEHRQDFVPTIWQPRDGMDIQQVWFAGAHSDIGGSYGPDKDGSLLSGNALVWMVAEARKAGLGVEGHLEQGMNGNPLATLHNSRRSFYRVKRKYYRPIDHGKGAVLLHRSVTMRWEQDSAYRPQNLKRVCKR